MSNVTVGVYEVDSRIYYIDPNVVVLDNPLNHIPTFVMRIANVQPTKKHMKHVMKEVGMEQHGEPYIRPDGLWCQELKEATNGSRK